MPELYRYSDNFDPIFLEGFTAKIFGSGLPQDGKNVRCVSVDAMPEYINDFGALTAGVWLTDQQDNNLEMNTYELSQLRIRVIDDVQVRLRNSPPVQRWRTLRTAFYLPQFPQGDDEFLKRWLWKASEFFVWENNDPMFEMFSSIATTTCRLLFAGWRFKMEEIKEPGRFNLWINDWPSRTPQV